MAKKTNNINKARWDTFCLEYVKDFNRTRAYKAAGYKPKSDQVARNAAHRLMCTNVYVIEKIQKLLEGQERRAEKTADDIIKELEKLAFSNITDVLQIKGGRLKVKDTEDLTSAQRAAISEISQTDTKEGGSLKVKMHEKRAALVDLGKRFGLFPNKQELEHLGKDGKPIVVQIVDYANIDIDDSKPGSKPTV